MTERRKRSVFNLTPEARAHINAILRETSNLPKWLLVNYEARHETD